jgi:hypothetical protein
MTTREFKLAGKADITSNLNVDEGTFFVDTVSNNIGIGKTNPGEKLDIDGTIKATGLLINNLDVGLVHTGFIALWGGNEADIPSGWRKCDGQDGRPLIQDSHAVGHDTSYFYGLTPTSLGVGGAETHHFNSPQVKRHNHSGGNSSGHNHNHNRNMGYAGHHSHPMRPARDVYQSGDRLTYWYTSQRRLFPRSSKQGGYCPGNGPHSHNWGSSKSNHGHGIAISQSGGSPTENTGTISVKPEYTYLYYIIKIDE